MSQKIGILGGTFDPIHQGHLILAGAAKEQFHLDKVLFVPALIPPHKAGRHDLSPAPYRCRMVEIAVTGRAGFEVSKVELNRPEISYTVDTLRAVKKDYPKAELYFILGSDALQDLKQWRKPGEIRKLATLLVARRGETSSEAYPERNIHWIDAAVSPLSSSEIRQMIQEGKPAGHRLPPGVEDYIRDMKLYRK